MTQAPWHHYPVAIFALAWSLVNAADYLFTKFQFPPYLSFFTLDQIAYFTEMPLYLDLAWAVTVWAGLIGAVQLLRRSRSAALVFAISCAGVIVTSVGLIFFTTPRLSEVTGQIGLWVMSASIVITFAIFIYARAMNLRHRLG